MPVAKPPPPDLTWSFELPDRLKLAIADAIVLHSRLESLCLECIWEIEKADLERKKEIAKNWASENYKLLKRAVAQGFPTAQTDKIWPALKALGKERNLIAHGVWMWTNKDRPLVVWHAKFLEDPDWVGAEWFDWQRFERFDAKVRVLVNTFNEFKRLLVKTADAQKTPPA